MKRDFLFDSRSRKELDYLTIPYVIIIKFFSLNPGINCAESGVAKVIINSNFLFGEAGHSWYCWRTWFWKRFGGRSSIGVKLSKKMVWKTFSETFVYICVSSVRSVMFIVLLTNISGKLRRSDMSENILRLRMKQGNIHSAPTELWFVVILESINMPPLTGFMSFQVFIFI